MNTPVVKRAPEAAVVAKVYLRIPRRGRWRFVARFTDREAAEAKAREIVASGTGQALVRVRDRRSGIAVFERLFGRVR